MKVLVIGNGCREHAIIQVLREDKKVEEIYCLPERMSLKETKGLPAYFLNDKQALANYLREEGVELIVIGPEKPLVEGLSDFLRHKGFKVFGACAKGAQLEGSKIFAKNFMKENNIPTASYYKVDSISETLQQSEFFFPPFVLKADGLAGGKGVFLCQTRTELEEKARFLFEKKALGVAGEQALLEEFQLGQEISVFVITNGDSYHILPVVQDYKRLYDNQKGPNTGGMGAIAPISIDSDLMKNIEDSIVKPTLKGLKQIGANFCGVLYFGLMIHNKTPKVLEYNVRFGDPEAQVLLPLLDGSWCDVFYKVANGELPTVKWKKLYSACVVLCAENYPEGPFRESPIEGYIYHKNPHSWFIHGDLRRDEDQWFTRGGRVMNVVALGENQQEAVVRAYKHIEKISWVGIHYRKDIGEILR